MSARDRRNRRPAGHSSTRRSAPRRWLVGGAVATLATVVGLSLALRSRRTAPSGRRTPGRRCATRPARRRHPPRGEGDLLRLEGRGWELLLPGRPGRPPLRRARPRRVRRRCRLRRVPGGDRAEGHRTGDGDGPVPRVRTRSSRPVPGGVRPHRGSGSGHRRRQLPVGRRPAAVRSAHLPDQGGRVAVVVRRAGRRPRQPAAFGRGASGQFGAVAGGGAGELQLLADRVRCGRPVPDPGHRHPGPPATATGIRMAPGKVQRSSVRMYGDSPAGSATPPGHRRRGRQRVDPVPRPADAVGRDDGRPPTGVEAFAPAPLAAPSPGCD